MTHFDPTLQIATLTALETAINAALALDSGTRRRLSELDQQVFFIQCTEPQIAVYIVIQAGEIQLHAHWEAKITTTLKGPATEYIRILNAEDRGTALINSDLSLRGDSAPLIKLQNILSDLQLDWEGQLAHLIGDIPAHLLGKTSRHLHHWGKQTRSKFLRHLEEFIHEEARLLPPRLEVDDFIDDVQRLKIDTERLNARIDKLKQRLANR